MKQGNDDRPGDAARRHFHVSRLALLLAVVLCVPIGCGPQPGTRVLTTVEEIRALRPADAERGYQVRVSGIATYYHAASNSLIVQNGEIGIFVDTGKTPVEVAAGREIEIEGITAAGGFSPTIVATSVKDLNAGVFPAARSVSIAELSSGKFSYRRVEVDGIVRSGQRENDGRLTLDVTTASGVFQARVIAAGAALVDGYLDSTVTVRGVADTTFNSRREPIRLRRSPTAGSRSTRWARESFDLVLMDVQMPEMDGFEATAEIRRRERGTGGHLRILAMTAHAMSGDSERCLLAGMDGYMSKPIDPHLLRSLVEEEAPRAHSPSGRAWLSESQVRSE